MDALLAQIESLLADNGGKMTYQALLDQIAFQDRPLLANALKIGKKQGKFVKVLRWNAEAKQSDFTVEVPVTEGA